MQSIPSFPSVHHAPGNRRTPLRLIEDERQPNYDGQPVQPERIEQRSTFRQIPDCVLDLRSPDATQVYAVLLRLARANTWCTASYKQLGDLAGMSDRQARRIVLLLIEHGMIRLEQRTNDGSSLPNRYFLLAHLKEETAEEQGMKSCHPPMTSRPNPSDTPSPPSDTMSDTLRDVNGYVEKQRNSPPPPPASRRKSETEQRDHEVVAWWCKVSGARQPADKGAALNAAHALLAAGFTLDTLPGLYEHVKANASVGATLPMLVKWADGYQAKHTPAKPVDDENPKLKGGMGLQSVRERKRLVLARKGCQLPSELPRYDERIAEIDATLRDLGVTVQEAEAWALRH